ncbi:hypothetical protein M427DRAFT_55760 [Gonapodya prolifera JEL478]|uniref:Uncharacterized protein n=1 Tax=Gonapodya prolifera (strain JEL478) TaxID=1344416 RepID=A0A139AHU8_GONPJ|nr:hypothetical protein M427DRAFT_55760 [Gonapodya prolifera JEL478]|eukprot:KXS16340.1 hypothetical protein M427DRAFT_55760 [Gonapodya prolifera JEL478]
MPESSAALAIVAGNLSPGKPTTPARPSSDILHTSRTPSPSSSVTLTPPATPTSPSSPSTPTSECRRVSFRPVVEVFWVTEEELARSHKDYLKAKRKEDAKKRPHVAPGSPISPDSPGRNSPNRAPARLSAGVVARKLGMMFAGV